MRHIRRQKEDTFMSTSKQEAAATLPPPSAPEVPGQDNEEQNMKEQKVRVQWYRYVRRLKASLRPERRVCLGEAIVDLREAVEMLEDLAAVIKNELACLRHELPTINDSLMDEPPEQRELIIRLDALRLKAWSFEVQAALFSARVSLKIAQRMVEQNQANYSWHAYDLEIYGEIDNVRRCLPTKGRFYLIDTDRAYEAFTSGRLMEAI